MNSVVEIGDNIYYLHEGDYGGKVTKRTYSRVINKELNDFVFCTSLTKKIKEQSEKQIRGSLESFGQISRQSFSNINIKCINCFLYLQRTKPLNTIFKKSSFWEHEKPNISIQYHYL